MLLLARTTLAEDSEYRGVPWSSYAWQQQDKAIGEKMLDVSIALAIQNVDTAVEALVSISDPTSSQYGQHWTPSKISEIFTPAEYAVSSVLEWLSSHGISKGNVYRSFGGGHLHLSLSVQEASQVLQTTFFTFVNQQTGRKIITSSHYRLPQPVNQYIDYIESTAEVPGDRQIVKELAPRSVMAFSLPPKKVDCEKFISPACLRKTYNISLGFESHPNNSIGVFHPSWTTWLAEDMDFFFDLFEPRLIGQRPEMLPINGGYTQTELKISPFNLESNLDFQYAMALAAPQKVINIQVGDASQPGNFNHMLAAFDKYYCGSLDPSVDTTYPPLQIGGYKKPMDCGTSTPPKVISISYAKSEAGFPPEYLRRQCLEFLKLGLMGVTVVVASADYGTASGLMPGFCIDPQTGAPNSTEGYFNPSWPSACPWVTTVGGTQLSSQSSGNVSSHADGAYQRYPIFETAFRFGLPSGTVLTSGGGFSNIFPGPKYQEDQVAEYQELEKEHLSHISNRFNSSGRAYPDISLQSNGFAIALYKKLRIVHGTSGAAPVFASMIALINNERLKAGKSALGFINPTLYANPGIFNDIRTGTNEGCGARPAFKANAGWDPVTGLGSPNFQKLQEVFRQLP